MKSTLPALLRTTRAATAMALVVGAAVVVPASLAVAVGGSAPLVISEFRVRGPSGANDEFIEIANIDGSPHTVASSGGTGYGVAASDGVTRCTIPDGTVIPGRGHYLCVNSGAYSLAGYPGGSGNATYTTDIPDNAGIALFNNNTGGGSYILANRLDAVGSATEANTLYKEGTGYPALTPFSIDYSFYRSLSTGTISGQNQIDTPTPGIPKDTDNNATDLIFVDTNGTSAGAGQRLGAPGPENLSSPVSGGGLAVSLLNDCVSEDAAPNVARDTTSDPANNSTFGTVTYRRTVTNNTGAPVTLLRLRVADIRTFPAPSTYADLRPRTATGGTVTVDRTSCGGSSSDVPVAATTLQQPPSQPNGGGFNSSLLVTLGSSLAPGASVNVNILAGVQQTGRNGVRFITEALPSAGTGTPALTCAGATIAGMGDNYCNLTPPTISAPSAGAVLTNGTVTVSGTGGTTGATVTATIVGPAPAVTESTCTSSVGSNGTWSCSPSSPLADGSYSVSVKQTDALSHTSPSSASRSFAIDSTAPAAPAVSVPSDGAALSNGAVTVSGDGGENGATVTATIVGPDPAVTQTTCTSPVGPGGSWSCSPLLPLADGSYSVTVKQADAASNVSLGSAPVSFTVDSAAPPAAPTGVSIVAGDQRLAITFTPPTSTGSAPITSYDVSVDGGGTWSALATFAGTGDTRVASLTDLQNGVSYAVQIRAVNSFGAGVPSVPAVGTPVAPVQPPATTPPVITLPPVISAVSPATGTMAGGTTVTVTGTGLGAVRSVRIGAVTLASNDYTVNQAGTTLTFTTPKVDAAGAVSLVVSGDTGNATAVYTYTSPPVDEDVTAPGVPTAVSTTIGNQRMLLFFTPPTFTGGAPITGYQVSFDGGRTWRSAATSEGAGETRFATLEGLQNGVTYRVQIRALNARYPSEASAAATGVPNSPTLPPIVPPAPLVPIPANPDAYRGKVRYTKALYTTFSGALARPITALGTHQLTVREAATVSKKGLFGFDSAKLTTTGRAQVKLLASHLRIAKAVRCEGYTDYAGQDAHELTLSRGRALAVCKALIQYGAKVRIATVGHKDARPVIIGGTAKSRTANRRVVVQVTS
ncbi:hypothetical protein Aco04nite_52300 [Winogradskya consettensis]|uniref:Uncharacterized protein n=1 Tax=Winogradskya consettensis TaxID=113560 RepID=A0A919W1T8_9ACTN|nr:hypothetical protein Aco04nite_52300 [Actinoplanes consettensis]